MRILGIPRIGRFTPAVLVALIATAWVPGGCAPRPSDRLVVATSWPIADRLRLESAFARWAGVSGTSGPRTLRLEWLVLSEGDDLVQLARRRNPPDVLLGGPATSFDHLARMNQFTPLPLAGSPLWTVARRSWIRLDGPKPRSSGALDSTGRAAVPLIAIDDPRAAPISLAWAKELLSGVHFREGYGRLVEVAGHWRRIGRQAGSASAAVDRGEADLAPRALTEEPRDGTSRGSSWIEGAAIPRESSHPDQARQFVQFLAETERTDRSLPRFAKTAESEGLLADLLGATLVDAQDELWSAWSTLEREGNPQNALRWMTEPPPWPPASVAKMMIGSGERGMSMVETLAGQLATEPPIRAWLVRSWLSPQRLIDDAMLEELAMAVDGQVCREPRFRDWLRAEWTAWARQRYRRVARLAARSAQ